MYRYKITFRYRDSLSHWEWRTQNCSLCANSKYEAQRKAIEWYGLGADCEYEIISVEETGND